jgi:nitrile hydratase
MSDHNHEHHHGHHHDHAQEGSALPEIDLRVRALESLLVEKGLVDPDALNVLIDTYETRVGPRNGAQVVARAWVDPAFGDRRAWLWWPRWRAHPRTREHTEGP